MPRTTIQNLLLVLRRITDELLQAAGDDPIISQKDYRKKRQELSGAHQLLFDSFFRFLRSLEENPSGRITAKDVEKGYQVFVDQILPHYQLSADHDLSVDEYAAISQITPEAAPLAGQLKRAAVESDFTMPSGDIYEKLKVYTKNLVFDSLGSESAQPVEPVLLEAQVEMPLSEHKLAAVLNLNPEDPREKFEIFEDAFDFFFHFIEVNRHVNRGRTAESVVKLMENNLEDITLVVIGEDYHPKVDPVHPVFVLGVAVDGNLVGFRSAVVWT